MTTKRCKNCRHFGTLKGIAGVVRATVCLAPADEGERFVYEASPHGECELFTPSACSRLAFEAWFRLVRFGHNVDLTRGPDGAYLECEPYWAWQGWQGKHFESENNQDDAHE